LTKCSTAKEKKTMNKASNNIEIPATVKPGDFPLGSPQSRAAARAILNSNDPDRYVIRISTNVKPSEDATPDYFDEKSGKPMYTRIVYGSKVK
jgi:hypothetical protein